MADLDDFFAKKDRKRQKAGRRGTDELPARREEAARPEPQPQPQPQHQAKDRVKEEDEWREVEVAKKADYTGLKIQHLTPGQENNPGIEGYVAGVSNNFGDQKSKGPWNKTASEYVEVKVEEKEPPPPSEVILPPPPSSNAYVPPLLRNRPPGYMEGPPMRKHGKQAAPDINSQEFFPVLGGEVRKNHGGGGGGGGGNWSEASRGAPPSTRPPPREVSLGNRFNSFTNDS